MKRTQQINLSAFRKCCRMAPLALAVGAAFTLAGCEKADETVSMYQNADDCTRANPSNAAQCNAAYTEAQKEAARTAPKYASREDCVAEFGEGQCTQAPAQAGAVAQPHESGSFWMPLMAGYMMGRMMSGGSYAQQPLFTSRAPNNPANGKFVDASGRNYGAATPGRTVTVPKTALAPKPATTRTITRGGFGETVAKQATAQRSSMSSGSRSFGG
ncbi:DUF1190 domain-containing protein [Chimaeribacter arupi]|uniref:DUF1190 domain-containing protein n=2 Tax=Yersiniaceae TaxID=1903411 RepID=A0A2N5EJH8_9GAMM|nr:MULTISPECIES: DUF1190 family protein [Yersiniaceae]MBS0969095.1 DUF1190 family protein [Nissabacter archeti]MDV5141641.1 DUF1190 family protein [Chimaeribacter arupi]PLR31084.1 DUF1190 domain-containing protein [Chimaeribacter arupi]PLR42271.1 DUF1190 domain-containing protein [Chimaeribacter arupi]PLR45903.1 DUF1190 domain-containing protein [Chimaeribacter arupi]